MTRAETLTILAEWIEKLRDRHDLLTIDDLLEKMKELQTQSLQGIPKEIVKTLKKRLDKLKGMYYICSER